jgi:uncharacterized protein YacL (UPF0231 family)
MNAVIENQVKGNQSFVNRVLHVIKNADNKEDLKTNIGRIFNLYYDADEFIYGFGGSHMWVANKSDNQRIIFVAL